MSHATRHVQCYIARFVFPVCVASVNFPFIFYRNSGQKFSSTAGGGNCGNYRKFCQIANQCLLRALRHCTLHNEHIVHWDIGQIALHNEHCTMFAHSTMSTLHNEHVAQWAHCTLTYWTDCIAQCTISTLHRLHCTQVTCCLPIFTVASSEQAEKTWVKKKSVRNHNILHILQNVKFWLIKSCGNRSCNFSKTYVANFCGQWKPFGVVVDMANVRKSPPTCWLWGELYRWTCKTKSWWSNCYLQWQFVMDLSSNIN